MTELLADLRNGRKLRDLNVDELHSLAAEVRELLVETVHANGDAGHLASNLGVVEISLALHRVFQTPRDKIVWDVGHQSYVHKLLTDRLESLPTIRRKGGLAGFPDRRESAHDAFGAGHAGTSLSAATGYALARDLRHDDYDVVAVVGDGGLTAGMSFEALNHLGSLGARVIVVFNDNGMSISPNVGALLRASDRLRASRDEEQLNEVARHAGFWQQLGFAYDGPFDGHDIEAVEKALRSARAFDGRPRVVHLLTEKGHGVAEAAADSVKSHSGTYWLKGPARPGTLPVRTFSQVFGDAAAELMARDERIVVITPAMLEGSGITALQKRFPDRVFDVAIAEQHSVTLAAGMAAAGLRPIVAIYSTFLQRAYDSVIHDIAVQGLPVIFAIDRAGLVGEDGRTHQGFADLSFLRLVPGMAVAAASDDVELDELLRTALTYAGPFAIRYPRGNAPVRATADKGATPAVGTGLTIRDGDDVTLMGIGTPVQDCLAASDTLKARGVSAGVVNARFAKPLDDELILQVATRGRGIVTVEENVQAGGFGEAVLALLSEHGMADRYLGAVTLPDAIIEHATQAEQRAACGVDANGIVRRVIELLDERKPLDDLDEPLPAGVYPISTTRAG